MLVLGPNSTCDVCLECYTTGVNVPHAISCGHVFCQKCLDHLMQQKCPLCRERFSPRDIRKLHVDRDPSTIAAVDSPSEPVVIAPQIDNESQRLLDDITRIVKEGGKVNEIRRVIDECRAYYKSQPGNQYTSVRVSCLLLHNLLEAQRKLVMQAEQIRETTATRDEIRDRLTSELEAVQLKYEDLERTSRDEKDTALAIEKSLREHYDQMNSFWKGWMETVNHECRSLREELDRCRSSRTMAPPPLPPRAVELQYFYRKEPKRSYSGSGDLTLSQVETAKGKVIDDEYDFHLSPLAEVTAPLISTAPSLMALADDFDQDEIVKAKRAKSPIQEEPEPESELDDPGNATAMAYPFPAHLQPPTTKVDPIPIPSRTPLSRQSSVMAMSITADPWPSNISCSKPRDDVVMSSQPPSPNHQPSSDRLAMPQGSRKESYTRETTDLKRRDSTGMGAKDHLVSKLHDLLDSPRPTSSLHGHMQSRADLPDPMLPLRPSSRVTVPSRPSSTAQGLGSSSTTSMTHYPDDPHGASDRKPLVRASDAAMQLEKERLERRRLRETSNSLKDATNVPVDVCHLTRHRSKGGGGGGKTKAPYPASASAEMYA
ncbi:hypothetical protein JVT61DRAFT_9781 [Boletus reticuloceps]|uniref:RING-type domain-containing protein n=1 Tax=Boletus reticuloceps TaxID=495285 RepID=A0A8I2YG75_9AGAM|nr:hypothetical protein JVT61DRAFT_9781 [Boletus reticuloceps]